MLFPFRRPRALLLSVPIVAASAFSAEGSPAAGGWAFNLSANFNAGGVNTAIEPYNVTNTVTAGVFDRTFNASAFGNRLILLTVDAAGPVLTYGVSKSLQTHVSQPFAPSSGTSAVVTKATLSGLTLPSRGGKPNPLFVTTYLHITADSIQQTGNFNRLASKATTVSSEAAIHNLVVTGTLVDGKTLKFSGVPTAEDQVLFHSPTVTITLGHSITAETILCSGSKCSATPYSITASGLQVTLTDAVLDGKKVSGQITIDGVHGGLEGGF